jgi:hypothetical protein
MQYYQGKSKKQAEYSLHGLPCKQFSLATGFGGGKLIAISIL